MKLWGLCVLLLGSSTFAATDASSLKLQVYSVALSTSPMCTSPTTVFSNTTATELDFLATPTLGGGNPVNGTYPCVIIKMLDGIKFTPKTTDGNCTQGQEYSDSVCQASELTNVPDSSILTRCTPSNDDMVYLYITTDKTVSGGGHAFEQPKSSSPHTNGVVLNTPLVISGTSRAKFVVDTRGQVVSANGTCGMNAPTFDFRTIP
jgi:hypothetical protein